MGLSSKISIFWLFAVSDPRSELILVNTYLPDAEQEIASGGCDEIDFNADPFIRLVDALQGGGGGVGRGGEDAHGFEGGVGVGCDCELIDG